MSRKVPQGGISGLLLAGICIYALNLRAPITGLPTVVTDVAADLALTPAEAGILTGLPVLCFALLTPGASAFLARLGVGNAVTVSLVTVLVGTLLRSVGGFGTALVGTVLIGAAITIGNVAVPVIVGRDFAGSASTVTGLYTAALNVGSVLTTTFTAPLAQDVGWRWALASWSSLAAIALVVWRFAARRLRTDEVPRPRPTSAGQAATDGAAPEGSSGQSTATGPPTANDGAGTGHHPNVLRRPLTWLLAFGFGCQAFGYYAVTAWLPTLLADQIGLPRESAGGAASLFQLLAIVGGIAVPMALARKASVRLVAMSITAAWLTLPIGLLVAPELWPLWCSLAGVAQGGNFTVIFTLVAVRTSAARDARRMSATVQTTGYACAALAPSAIGAVHTASSGWTVPLAVMLADLLLMTVLMAIATSARPRD